jgi:hypothetical protein
MSDQDRTQDTTPRDAQPDNFRPADAVESLRAAILRVDTIAQVASDAVEELRYPVNAEARRAFARMQILVDKAAEEASAALTQGDELMAALTKHLRARRDTRELGDRRDVPARPALARRRVRSSPRARARGARRR